MYLRTVVMTREVMISTLGEREEVRTLVVVLVSALRCQCAPEGFREDGGRREHCS